MNNQNSNIRRIDELGRIVIPKDIRKKLHIKDNETLEIFIDEEEIRIKKYSALPDILEHIKYLVDMVNRITSNQYIITDRTNIIASSNKDLINDTLTEQLSDIIISGREYENKEMNINISNKCNLNGYINISSILIDNDRTGIIIEYSSKPLNNNHITKILKNLIEKKLNTY